MIIYVRKSCASKTYSVLFPLILLLLVLIQRTKTLYVYRNIQGKSVPWWSPIN